MDFNNFGDSLFGNPLSNNNFGFGGNDIFGQNDQYPNHQIFGGPCPTSVAKYCVQDGKIYEGPVPMDVAIACIQGNQIYAGPVPTDVAIACIEDGKIYRGPVPTDVASFSIF